MLTYGPVYRGPNQSSYRYLVRFLIAAGFLLDLLFQFGFMFCKPMGSKLRLKGQYHEIFDL
jgi:hypothetical protein